MSIYKKGTIKSWLDRWALVLILLMLVCSHSAFSQDDRKIRRSRREKPVIEAIKDSIPFLTDSLKAINDSITARRDSIVKADSIAKIDSSTEQNAHEGMIARMRGSQQEA